MVGLVLDYTGRKNLVSELTRFEDGCKSIDVSICWMEGELLHTLSFRPLLLLLLAAGGCCWRLDCWYQQMIQ